MLPPISSALPGLSAASRQSEAAIPSRDAPGALPTAGTPISEAAYRPAEAEPTSAISRDGVDRSARADENASFDGTYAPLRSSIAAHQAVEPSDAPDPASSHADKARATEAAAERAREATNAVVARRYDIGQSY